MDEEFVPESTPQQDAAFVEQFKRITKNPENNATNTVRFFKRGSKTNHQYYYTAHGNDAQFIVRDYIKTDRSLKMLGSQLPSCVVNRKLFAEVVAHLWRKANIEVWEKENREEWQVVQSSSPGKVDDFEDIVLRDDGESAVVIAVTWTESHGGCNKFSCGVCNTTTRTFQYCEFGDSTQCRNLESFLIQSGAKECLTYQSTPPELVKQLGKVLQELDIVHTSLKKSYFSTKEATQLLRPLLRDDSQWSSTQSLGDNLSALLACVRHLKLDTESAYFAQFSCDKAELDRFLVMDSTALRSLDIFPQNTRNATTTTYSSLFSLLNRCRTASGSRLLRQWMSQPLLERKDIEKRQDLVQIFVENVFLKQLIRDEILTKVPDLDGIIKKVSRKATQLRELVGLAKFLELLPLLKDTLAEYSGNFRDVLKGEYVEPLAQVCEHVKGLVALITTTLVHYGSGNDVCIDSTFDDDLQQLAAQRKAIEQSIQSTYSNILHDLCLEEKHCKLEKTNNLGYFVRVTKGNNRAIEDNSTYKTLEVRKDGIKFANNKLLGLNTQYKDIHKEYEDRQGVLVTQLQDTIATYMPVLQDVKDIITTLDVLIGFSHAAMSVSIPYERPTILPKEAAVIDIKAFRHPILEMQQGVNCIENSVYLNRNDKRVSIITGPNMGGKSTYIRSIGLVQMMAQLGMSVPCTSCRISICSSIYTRVGATDYQSRGISTFMSEMTEVSTILKSANEHSLIIIDELGRGTSTYDGYGLAWAIIDHITVNLQCFCLFATHFHEVTNISKKHKAIENVHVAVHTNDGKVTMLYEVKQGACSKSFGIRIAELAKFPQVVIDSAKRKAAALERLESKEQPQPKKSRYNLTSFPMQLLCNRTAEQGTQPVVVALQKWATTDASLCQAQTVLC